MELLSPAASPEEAAAVVAALERFMRDTARPQEAHGGEVGGWRRAALLEAVDREHDRFDADPWINT